ncbi:hypothetical protein ABZS66_15460 [Dactylosporangium sp. NPDC005572]|uniref:carboxymuconolactone decarboxylase family protein n=1 Tax=Dactylosporangium sp. NPDC005572 TaxID=3156889 RepID=UPI0033BE6163
MMDAGFLSEAAPDPQAQLMFDEDVADFGAVMNVSRLWAYQPASFFGLVDLLRQSSVAHGISGRQRGILVAACASTLGDSYCSLSWGTKLAAKTDVATAAGVIRGEDSALTPAEQAIARWARKVARWPQQTTEEDVRGLRDAGFTDRQIFGVTLFVALRVAFSSVNGALGVRPDAFFRELAPQPVLDAVTFGRPIAS